MSQAHRNPTRPVRIGSLTVGDGHPIAVQSMCATKTADVEATVAQIEHLVQAGAEFSAWRSTPRPTPPRWLKSASGQRQISLAIQENYGLAKYIALSVSDKIRYNPGHLYHMERSKPWQDKVKFLVNVAAQNNSRCGWHELRLSRSGQAEKYPRKDRINPMMESAWNTATAGQAGLHAVRGFAEELRPGRRGQGQPHVRRKTARRAADLGVTEAGMPPEGVHKTEAFEELIAAGIGDTIRVSLTVPAFEKEQEIAAGRKILNDIAAGRFVGMPAEGARD